MTAKEMFEEVGYKKRFKIGEIYINKAEGSRIIFGDRFISIDDVSFISCELLKAINLRCKELGWFE